MLDVHSKKIFAAHSANQSLRERGGGGVITTVLVNALETGIISNALVVIPDQKEPWAQYINATRPQEILQAAGSKYTLLSFGKLEDQISQTTAVVGLPCQISKIKNIDCYKLGLFCGISLSRRGFKYLLRQLNIDKDQINFLDYRKAGGGLRVEMNDGSIIEYPGYSWLSYFFSYPFCLECTDNTNHDADLSVGDRHFEGSSNVIVHTDKGLSLFQSAIRNKKLIAKEITPDELFNKIKTPYYIKEVEGGYKNLWYVRTHGKWIEKIPLPILRLIGGQIMRYSARKSRNYFQKNISKKNE